MDTIFAETSQETVRELDLWSDDSSPNCDTDDSQDEEMSEEGPRLQYYVDSFQGTSVESRGMELNLETVQQDLTVKLPEFQSDFDNFSQQLIVAAPGVQSNLDNLKPKSVIEEEEFGSELGDFQKELIVKGTPFGPDLQNFCQELTIQVEQEFTPDLDSVTEPCDIWHVTSCESDLTADNLGPYEDVYRIVEDDPQSLMDPAEWSSYSNTSIQAKRKGRLSRLIAKLKTRKPYIPVAHVSLARKEKYGIQSVERFNNEECSVDQERLTGNHVILPNHQECLASISMTLTTTGQTDCVTPFTSIPVLTGCIESNILTGHIASGVSGDVGTIERDSQMLGTKKKKKGTSTNRKEPKERHAQSRLKRFLGKIK